MSPNQELTNSGLNALRINPKYYLDLLCLAVLSVSDRIPANLEQLENAVERLKVEKPETHQLVKILKEQIPQTEIVARLKDLRLITKADFLSQNRMTILLALISDDRIQNSQSDPILAEFVKHFASMINSGNLKSVLDPAFGLGTLIYSAFNGSDGPETEIDYDETGKEIEVRRLIARKIVGSDIHEGVVQVARQLGELLGFETEIKVGNALRTAQDFRMKHDLVVCEPPAGLRLDEDLLRQDWPYGRPAKSSADWAWGQIVQNHVAESGYGLLFVTSGALFRSNPNDVLVRAKMVGSGAIRAVINLPSGMSPAHRANMSLIVFGATSRNSDSDNRILFIDMTEPDFRRGTFEYTKNLIEKIHDACDVFADFENGFFDREVGYTAALSVSDPELLKNDMNLNPSLYVTQMVTGIDTKLSVKKDVSNLGKKIAELTNLAKQAEVDLSTFSVKAEFVNLGELIATGKIIQVLGMSKNDLKENRVLGVKYDADSGDRVGLEDEVEKRIQYISVEDIRQPGELQQTGSLRPDLVKRDNALVLTEPGDVVLIKTGRPAAKVDRSGNKHLFSPLTVLRITPEGGKTISPEVLAFVLNGERVKKFMQGTTIGRLQIESVPIPIMESVNTAEINRGLDLVQRLLMKSLETNNELIKLEQKLNQVLAGEFDGLQEER